MSAYTDSVEHYLQGIEAISTGGALADCPQCSDLVEQCEGNCGASDPGKVCYCSDEGSFSWEQCDGCGSTFGGDRHTGHGIIPAEGKKGSDALRDGELIHLEFCVDCVFYLANGDEPEQWKQHP